MCSSINHKEGSMRFIYLAVTTLCVTLAVATALAKDKKSEKQMDPQAMMETNKRLATPGEPHKLFASLAGRWTSKTKEWMEPDKQSMKSTVPTDMKIWLVSGFLRMEVM